ncbi:SPOR domain-containing protein [Jannaschia pohangensis]|uniref:Sporulation related domain-containing protein n=1 Tax=Jannaschia pohangensis TaxID=390807 RepID=A0A1I3SBW9_9RHOB|nr:SPOR domain-containing protein [Jannaschia pohangensis]SFJ55119.1 Sporulation related domain-containing protein [Jannaschia pohangensis]
MADLDYYGADYGTEESSRFMDAARNFGFVNWAGALTSIGLTAGMAVWAIDMTFRDVSGVPVIMALEGPMRTEPTKPGGQVAPFQGLALSDITSGGAAAPAPDQIVLAPPPVSLEAPALAERRAAAGITAPAPAPVVAATATPVPDVTVDPALLQASLRVIEDEILVSASSPVDVVAAAEAALAPSAPTGPEVASLVPATVPGVAQSTRPRQRPAGLRPTIASLPTDAPETPAGVQVASNGPVERSGDVDPNSIAAGTRVVQVGAFDSEQLARGEWDRLQGKFGDYMYGKQRMIQKARSGGRDFWRLRVVGFDDGSDARRFCSALLAQDAVCMPVTIR